MEDTMLPDSLDIERIADVHCRVSPNKYDISFLSFNNDSSIAQPETPSCD